MSLNSTFTSVYASTSENLAFFAKAVSERPSRTLIIAAETGGKDAVMAVLDALLDAGHRNVLVQALNSPNLPGAVRDQLTTLLYGSARQTVCALLSNKQLH